MLCSCAESIIKTHTHNMFHLVLKYFNQRCVRVLPYSLIRRGLVGNTFGNFEVSNRLDSAINLCNKVNSFKHCCQREVMREHDLNK